jgi:hypothetical protein
MEFDEVPELPTFKKGEIFDVEVCFEEFKNAKNRVIMYELDREYRIGFDKLSVELHACSGRKNIPTRSNEVWEFLKLALEGVRLVKKQNNKV